MEIPQKEGQFKASFLAVRRFIRRASRLSAASDGASGKKEKHEKHQIVDTVKNWSGLDVEQDQSPT